MNIPINSEELLKHYNISARGYSVERYANILRSVQCPIQTDPKILLRKIRKISQANLIGLFHLLVKYHIIDGQGIKINELWRRKEFCLWFIEKTNIWNLIEQIGVEDSAINQFKFKILTYQSVNFSFKLVFLKSSSFNNCHYELTLHGATDAGDLIVNSTQEEKFNDAIKLYLESTQPQPPTIEVDQSTDVEEGQPITVEEGQSTAVEEGLAPITTDETSNQTQQPNNQTQQPNNQAQQQEPRPQPINESDNILVEFDENIFSLFSIDSSPVS